MSILDIRNKKIEMENEHCNNFVMFREEIKEYTKLLKHKEIVGIEYKIKVTFR